MHYIPKTLLWNVTSLVRELVKDLNVARQKRTNHLLLNRSRWYSRRRLVGYQRYRENAAATAPATTRTLVGKRGPK